MAKRRAWLGGVPKELNLGLLLFIPYRAMEKAVLEALAAAGFDDITLAQVGVFQRMIRTGRGSPTWPRRHC